MVPRSFQPTRALAMLNVAAVAFAMASLTAITFGAAFAGMGRMRPCPDAYVLIGTGPPTALVGAIWASLLRSQRPVGRMWIRACFASVALAVLDAALADGLLALADGGLGELIKGAVMAASFGVVFWLPALAATLLCFGIPIAVAQRLAARGLSGEERGERLIGVTCAGMSLAALVLALRAWHEAPPYASIEKVGRALTLAFAVCGVLAGGVAAALASLRERRRRRLVARAEAGNSRRYRVDESENGQVLICIQPLGGYRAADAEAAVFDLDAYGLALRPREDAGAKGARPA